MKRRLLALALAVSGLVPAATAWSATTLNGEYQLMMELRKNFRAFPWDWNSNDPATSNPARFWLLSTPVPGAETYVGVRAQWNKNDNGTDRPEFQYESAHIKYHKDGRPHGGQARGFEAMLFSREDRFWANTYLIPFVNGRGDAQGIRMDFWTNGLNTTFIAADQSNQLDPADAINGSYGSRLSLKDTSFPIWPIAPIDSLLAQRKLRTDDMYVARMRREFLKGGALRLGLTWNRSVTWAGRDSASGPGRWNSVVGFDSRYHFPIGPSVIRGADLSVEYGQSAPSWADTTNPQLAFFKHAEPIRLSDRGVFETELRSLKFGTPKAGYLNVAPKYWMRGPQYLNSMGGPNTDETGFLVQSYYFLPDRAITYSNQLLWYGKKVESRNRSHEVYNELYVEFVNGFVGKTAYKRHEDFAKRGPFVVQTVHDSWFNEVQVESKLAWLRVESKLQDIGLPQAKQLFVIEERLNLTEHTKIYNRFALGNDPTILRKGIFTQIQYRPTSNMEAFIQYGPDDIGNASIPVEESNLGGSGDQTDVFKFILKGSF